MPIPDTIGLPKDGLPDKPGVYRFRNARGTVIYVGKASSLRTRVSSYWRVQEQVSRPQVKDLIREARRVEVTVTSSVLEALILEANEIKKYDPKYNIMQKDAKSFLYLVITKDDFPRPLLVRGHELEKTGAKRYKAVFGPYVNPGSLRAAMKLVRKIFPWSVCTPGQKRACFDYHLGRCPGVCIGEPTKEEYARVIRHLILFFQGKKGQLVRDLERDMKRLAKEERFEEAAEARSQIRGLEHINDVAILTREESEFFGHPRRGDLAVNVFGRIEGYDISNISGTSAVGSMVVFEDGEASKRQYRKFKIRTVKGSDDYAMLEEVLRRRFSRIGERKPTLSADGRLVGPQDKEAWPLPDLVMIDGGIGQVNVAKRVLGDLDLEIPVVGIAKGFDRKQDQLVYDRHNVELARVVTQYKEILQRLRDEAHRFAIGYHRKLRGRKMKE